MNTEDNIRIAIPARFVITGIALVLFILLSFSAISAFDTDVWTVLKDVATDYTASVSVDANENGIIDNTDACGIGSTCEMQQLKMTLGNPGPGKALFSDATGLAYWQEFGTDIFPPHAVAFFEGEECPGGWSEFSAAQGRYIVGLPAGGTLGGTVGPALTNLEDRPIGSHKHLLVEAGHNHGFTHPYGPFIHTQNGSGMGFYGSTKYNATLAFTHYLTNYAPSFDQDVLPAGTGGTNAPYVQYIVCEKT